jgi:L-threonylcarbamoyladenylate synthase
MNQLNIKTLEFQKEFLIEEINEGKIFIYPTDTVYGIGCDASNDNAVKKIFEIKKRESKPLLVIAPSKEWIFENCDVNIEQTEQINSKLPGPVSFILKLKKSAIENKIISNNLLCGKNTIGVRIPDSKFTSLITQLNKPFVTTSVNISGEKDALNLEDIPREFLSQVDYVVDSDESMSGKSSNIFDLTGYEIKQLR